MSGFILVCHRKAVSDMAFFNVESFDHSLMFSKFNDYWNSDIYNNWPNSGDSSSLGGGIVSAGTPLTPSLWRNYGGVTIWAGSSMNVEVTILGTTYTFWGSSSRDTRLFFIMNDSVKGFRVGVYYYDGYYQIRQASKVVNAEKYDAILASIQPSYNFQSVPSLIGKGKEIILPQLISTDGKPVSNGSATDFSAFPTESKVRTLADSNLE